MRYIHSQKISERPFDLSDIFVLYLSVHLRKVSTFYRATLYILNLMTPVRGELRHHISPTH